jgi:Amt family ammonium transporter
MIAAILIAAVGTIIICVIVEKTIGFRLDEHSEMAGLDSSLHGERAYGMLNA